MIPNQPSDRAYSISDALYTDLDAVTFRVSESLYELSLGPQIEWQAASWLRLKLRPVASLNVVDADVQRTEVFERSSGQVLNRWSDQKSKCEVFPGLGLTGGADFELGKGYYIGVFGGYEWVLQNAKIEIGPNTVSLNASGFTAGAVVGKRF